MKNATTKLNERLMIVREKKNLSISAMSKKLGVSRGTVYNYETGASIPDAETLKQYQKIGNVSGEWLLNGVEISDYDLYLKVQSLSKFNRDKLFKIAQILEE